MSGGGLTSTNEHRLDRTVMLATPEVIRSLRLVSQTMPYWRKHD